MEELFNEVGFRIEKVYRDFGLFVLLIIM